MQPLIVLVSGLLAVHGIGLHSGGSMAQVVVMQVPLDSIASWFTCCPTDHARSLQCV